MKPARNHADDATGATGATAPDGSSKRKLPRMNASERAKYYRARVREYMERLEAVDDALARDVQHLDLLRTLQQRLVALRVAAARPHILAHVWQYLDDAQYLRQHALTSPRLHVRSLTVRGDEASGIIVHLDAVVHGAYAPETIERQLYPFFPGNTRLLDKLLRTTLQFPSAFRFYFDSAGALVQHTTETDFASALVDGLACSASELRQLLRALGEPDAIHQTQTHAAMPTSALFERRDNDDDNQEDAR